MRRQILGKVMLVCLLLCCICSLGAMASSDTKMMNCHYLNGLGLDADTWCALDLTREYFVMAMIMDGMDAWTATEQAIPTEALAYNSMYIAQDGNSINMFAFGLNDMMLFRYNAATEMGYYSTTSLENGYLLSDKYMDAMNEQYNFSAYYKVDKKGVMDKINSYLNQ